MSKKIPSKKIPIKRLKNKIWKEIRALVKERDDYRCFRCGKKVSGSTAHCSHILPKGEFPGYQFELWNLKTACHNHHLQWWHKSILSAADFFRRTYPNRYAFIMKKEKEYKRNNIKTPSRAALTQLYADLISKTYPTKKYLLQTRLS